MYQLIASDLDGTLLNAAHAVSETTKTVVQQLVARGLSFVIATGRHFLDAKDIRQALNIETYLITSNGARVHDHQGTLIYQKNIDPDMAKALLQSNFSEGAIVNLYRDEGWFIDQPQPWLLDMHETSGFQYQLFSPKSDKGEGISKIFYIGEHSALLALQAKIEAYLGMDALSITFSMPECLEIMDKGVSKAAALAQVVKLQGLTLANCLAFGDGLNDYELLSGVGKGLIMANGHEALKLRLPNQEVIGHHAEDAVAKYLASHYQLPIEENEPILAIIK